MSLVRREPGLLALVGATALLDAVASVLRQVHMLSGVDTAIFDQAVWHYSRFEAPLSSIKGENLLGDHFHPLVALLAPLYWVWSDPRMLLIAQSALIAASIIPVFLFAESRLGRAGAYLIAGSYAAFWGLQVGVLFEFHEVAFAPLLIALSILFADRRQWGRLWLVVVLLLAVKEDLSILVVFLGIYLLTQRQWRQGAGLAFVGIAWYEIVTRVLMPDLAHGQAFQYWSYNELGSNPLDAIWALVKAPWKVFTIGFSPSQKAQTIVELLAPFLFLSLGSRLFILALPLLAERFLSTSPALWADHFHYSISISPVLAMGAAGGLANAFNLLVTRGLLPERRRRAAVIVGAGTMLLGGLAWTLLGASDSVPSQLTKSSFYRAPAYAAGAYAALRHVPAGASLATVDAVLSHASERGQIEQLDPHTAGRNQYVLVNVTDLTCCGSTGSGSFAVLASVLHTELAATTPAYYDDGWVLGRRPAGAQRPTNGVLTPIGPSEARALARLAVTWGASLDTAFAQWFTCVAKWRANDPATTACFTAADGRFQVQQTALAGLLARVLASLGGGCEQIAHAALAGTKSIAGDMRLVVPASGARDRVELPAALRRVSDDVQNRDLNGPFDRLVVLCTPRP